MAFNLPEIHQATLPGGMKLLGVEYDRVPWLSLTFMAKRGAETDPLDKPGVADWAAELLTLGTARRTQLQLAEDIESRGAALNARSGWDATLVNLEGLSEDFPELMATMAEVVQTPGFPEDEFSLLAERRRAELVHQQDDPREMANIRYLRLFFGDSPYGHAVPGELPRLDNIGVADLQEFYRREFTPATGTLVVVGMEAFARVKEEAARLWGSWTGGGPASPPYVAAPAASLRPGDLSPGPARPDPERNPGRAPGTAPGPPRLLPPEAGELYPGRRRLFLPPHGPHPLGPGLHLRHPQQFLLPPGPGSLHGLHLHPGGEHRPGGGRDQGGDHRSPPKRGDGSGTGGSPELLRGPFSPGAGDLPGDRPAGDVHRPL